MAGLLSGPGESDHRPNFHNPTAVAATAIFPDPVRQARGRPFLSPDMTDGPGRVVPWACSGLRCAPAGRGHTHPRANGAVQAGKGLPARPAPPRPTRTALCTLFNYSDSNYTP